MNDGGPSQTNLTVRDEYVIAAMSAMLQQTKTSPTVEPDWETIARRACQLADYMMIERELEQYFAYT